MIPVLSHCVVRKVVWDMAHLTGKLTKKLVETLGPGRHGDGNGLHLVVDPSGALWLGTRTGYLVEYRDTQGLFEDPREDYTKQYLAGEFS